MKIFAAILILATSLCGASTNTDVLLLGDSLMSNSAEIVKTTLLTSTARNFFVMDLSLVGTAFAYASNDALYYQAQGPIILARHPVNAVVVSLGANDIALNEWTPPGLDLNTLATQAVRLIDAYAGRPFLWILPHRRMRELAVDPSQYDRVIMAITVAGYFRPTARLLSFDDYAAAHGATMIDLCLPNDIHLNAAGKALWSQMILDNVISL